MLAMLAVASVASPARAYERQLGVFAGAGYTGIATATPYPPHAVHVTAGVAFGLGDVWELRVRADYAFHVASAHALAGSVDLVYVLDVLTVVPYLGVSVGGAVSVFDASLAVDTVRGDFLAGGLVGLDVLLDRQWTVGAEVRVHVTATDFDRRGVSVTGLGRAQVLFEL